MEENLNQIKRIIIAGFGTLTGFLGILAVPVYILIFANITDYITALFAAKNRGQKIESNIGIKGIVKKVNMWMLIIAGGLTDALLLYSSSVIGISFPFKFLIACMVAIWLCVNEIVSILENISDILGDDMPSFLLPLVKNIRNQVEENINKSEGK